MKCSVSLSVHIFRLFYFYFHWFNGWLSESGREMWMNEKGSDVFQCTWLQLFQFVFHLKLCTWTQITWEALLLCCFFFRILYGNARDIRSYQCISEVFGSVLKCEKTIREEQTNWKVDTSKDTALCMFVSGWAWKVFMLNCSFVL